MVFINISNATGLAIGDYNAILPVTLNIVDEIPVINFYLPSLPRKRTRTLVIGALLKAGLLFINMFRLLIT